MPAVAMASRTALSKWPNEPSEVEKPPVAMVVMEWTTDSKPLIPPNQ